MLYFNPATLYVTIYEASQKPFAFTAVKHQIQTSEIERIGIDHAANFAIASETASPCISRLTLVAEHLKGQASAIKMLSDRIQILQKYALDISAGLITADDNIMKELASICHQLPVNQSAEFEKAFNKVA